MKVKTLDRSAQPPCSKCKSLPSVYLKLKKCIEKRRTSKVRHLLDCHVDFVIAEQQEFLQLTNSLFEKISGIIESQEPISEILKLLFDNGVSVHDHLNKNQETVLHLAVKYRLTHVIDYLLTQHHVSLNKLDDFGETALHFMLRYELKIRNPEDSLFGGESAGFIGWMISRGLDVNCQDIHGDPALHAAAKNNLLRAVDVLLDHTTDVTIVDQSRRTAFQVFAMSESVGRALLRNSRYRGHEPGYVFEIYEKFLNKGFSVDVVDANGNGTVLQRALKLINAKTLLDERSLFIDIVELIARNTRNTNARDRAGDTALHALVNNMKSNCCSAFTNKYCTVASVLLSNGADAHQRNNARISPLLSAVLNNAARPLLKVFADSGADVRDRFGSEGRNLLHDICTLKLNVDSGALKAACELLVNEGCDIDAQDSAGMTPLLYACQNDDTEMAVKLIELGANVNARVPSSGYAPLHIAVEEGRTDLLDKLIEWKADANARTRTGCDIDAQDSAGMTPLLYACQNGDTEIAVKLIDLGADVNARVPSSGYAPLHIAVEEGRTDLLDKLIEWKADANVRTRTGKTPLHLVKSPNESAIGKLVGCCGAFVDLPDDDGYLPLHSAIAREDNKTVAELLAYGSDINNKVDILDSSNYVSKYIIQHLIKIVAVGLPVDKKLKSGDLEYITLRVNANNGRFFGELQSLQKYEIDGRTSLRDLLRMNNACAYIKNEKLTEMMSSSTFKTKFPAYHGLISATYYKAVARNNMMEPAVRAWYELTDISLPELCVRKILSNLSNLDLCSMIAGTSDSLSNEINAVERSTTT